MILQLRVLNDLVQQVTLSEKIGQLSQQTGEHYVGMRPHFF
jgi:hypothetical protein